MLCVQSVEGRTKMLLHAVTQGIFYQFLLVSFFFINFVYDQLTVCSYDFIFNFLPVFGIQFLDRVFVQFTKY